MEKHDILKKCKKYSGSNDYLYYLIHNKQADVYSIIMAPCNYLYKNDKNQFFGTCIYTSENNISDMMKAEFSSKKMLLGIPMVKVAEKTDAYGAHFLDNRQIKELPFRYKIDAEPKFDSSLFPAYNCFACEDVIDIIDPRTALTDLCRRNEDFRLLISALTKQFEITTEQVGVIGSAALGAETPGDYDIVFYGDVDELHRINSIVADINKKQGVPKSDGLPLPFRMIFEGYTVDIIYVYDVPMLDGIHSARMVKQNVEFSCHVTDESLGLQVCPYFKVDGDNYSSLLIAESFFHAVIQKGDIVEGCGDILQWEHNGKTENVMFCRYPFEQLKDPTRYFYRYE